MSKSGLQYQGKGGALLFLFLILFLAGSCKYFKGKSSKSDEQPVARVQEEYLYYSDIEPLLKSAGQTQDSASFLKSYIEDWVKRKLMIQKALLYLPEEQLNIDRQVNDYRESLILYAYEKELILQKLDTVVPEEDALKYFEQYKQNFELEAEAVQLQYIKVLNNAPKLDSLKRWFASNREPDKIKVEDYCYQYAADFSLKDSMWFDVPALLKTIPVTQSELDAVAASKTRTTVNDSVYHYMLKVNDFRKKGEIAPFEFVKDDIIRLTLNKRKMDLVRSTYDNIYTEAQRKNEFEVYK